MKIAIVSLMCNSDFLLKEWLNHYRPLADYICVAEGATEKWVKVLDFKTPRSTDNTNDILNIEYSNNEKFFLTRKLGYYNEKLEQINYAMSLVPEDTDYVWEIDDDEFYMAEDFLKIKELLEIENYTYVEFKQMSFFKGFEYVCRGGDGWAYETAIPRIFKYHPGAKFSDHRPPTVLNESGVDVKTINPLLASETSKMDIYFRHYSYVDRKRVFEKLKYYDAMFPKRNGIDNYYEKVWFENVWDRWTPENRVDIERVLSVHPSSQGAYTEKFNGIHPIKIK
jgi:hypothetical protein